MAKAHTVLWYQSAKGVQHVARHVRICVLVYCQSSSSVLHIQNDHAFLFAGGCQLFLHFIRELNQLFTLARFNLKQMHGEIVAEEARTPRNLPKVVSVLEF